MRLEKDNQVIASIADWKRLAPPKSHVQWVEGRSAFELARAWCGSGRPEMPATLRSLLDSREETRGLSVDLAIPEHRIAFDSHGGESRNADLAFVGRTALSTIAVTIEAKADETFGATIAETAADTLERLVENPLSHGLLRLRDLVIALMPKRQKAQPKLGTIRYQLLTAAAGTLAYASQVGASTAVLIVHEFVTDKTVDDKHRQNEEDYRAFLHRLGGQLPAKDEMSALLGPFIIPGVPLFSDSASLLIGKTVTNLRGHST